MNNRYISRYAKHDTTFHRTDPWKYASWGEKEYNEPMWLKVLGSVSLVVILCMCVLLATI